LLRTEISCSSRQEPQRHNESNAAPTRTLELAHSVTPEPVSETMAPPMSSSPSSHSEAPRTRLVQHSPTMTRGRSLRRRTPAPLNEASPPSSPPSLTHSPNRPTRAVKKQWKSFSAQQRTFSTAELQALLPRRRRRAALDAFDIVGSDSEVDISGSASDDDDISPITVRQRSRPRGIALSRTPAPLKNKAKAKSIARAATRVKGQKRTYGTNPHNTSDKENEDIDPDDSLGPLPDDDKVGPENSQEMEESVGKELKRAARKFEEVDKWELDFEEVTASSSSPRDAR